MSRREPGVTGTPLGRGEVELPAAGGTPFVAAGVDPRAIHAQAAYAAGINARMGSASLPKAQMPLNPPRPPIPHLAGGPTGEGTMADFARQERAAAAGVPRMPSTQAQESILDETTPVPTEQRTRASMPSLKLLPSDLLPSEAASDPAFVQGQGSQFAMHQPALAAKYGVMRNGVLVPPQKLLRQQSGQGLRPETVRDLNELHRLSENPVLSGEQTSEQQEREVETGAGGAAARVGNEPGDRSVRAPTTAEREAVLQSAIEKMDSFELSQWRQMMMRQILHGEEERKLIESRLKPLDIGELISRGFIRQRIPIRPRVYEITLQSYDGQTDLALKRLVMQESKSIDVGEQYSLDKYGFMMLAVGLHQVNEKIFSEVVDANGNFSDEMFLAKFNQVLKLPMHMLASIGVNQMWFEMRVRKLYSASAVGNG